jgi:hypothetical protein
MRFVFKHDWYGWNNAKVGVKHQSINQTRLTMSPL